MDIPQIMGALVRDFQIPEENVTLNFDVKIPRYCYWDLEITPPQRDLEYTAMLIELVSRELIGDTDKYRGKQYHLSIAIDIAANNVAEVIMFLVHQITMFPNKRPDVERVIRGARA